jgi:SAM-dependent methyltransferase
LSLLQRVYAGFISDITRKAVLDFGCGFGWQVLAMACYDTQRSVGIESDPSVLRGAKDLACRIGFPSGKVEFHRALGPDLCGGFDLVISQNAMEHFPDPVGALKLMRQALKPGGRILITFGPPWLAPYGSHMHFFTKMPWVNILFKEKTVMAVRRHFRNDGAARYDQIRKGLNKMTLSKFEHLVAECGVRPVYWKLECVRGLDWLAKLPLLREFFVNHVTCMLAEDPAATERTVSRPGLPEKSGITAPGQLHYTIDQADTISDVVKPEQFCIDHPGRKATH